MSAMRNLKRQQSAAQRKEVEEGTRTQIIKTSTVLPTAEPRNAAEFQVEETRRAAAGEPAQTIPTPDKGKVAGAKGSKKPPRSGARDPPASESGSGVPKKRPSEGENPPAKKGKGKATEATDRDSGVSAAAIARYAAASELERMTELVATQRKVSKILSNFQYICS